MYARFYKCDLHMHTPLDLHWRQDGTRLRHTDSDKRKQQIARAYLKACHDAGLEAIAVTDHNFAPSPEESFVNWLHQENKAVAQKMERPPLLIFPGFEVEADVGKGCHVLCLFPPDTPLPVVDSRLTTLGLPPEKRFDQQKRPRQSTVRLLDILETVQMDPDYTGIVIAPHPFDRKGICDDDRIEMWLQQEEFKNPDLLCIELPKPLEEMSEGLKKMVRGGDDCLLEWRRERPIAYVMGSDCYRLHRSDQDPGNYIGFRHTWIKMSRPSIESLRQAFLDRDSGIRFGPQSPEEAYTYPKLRRISVQGATFLKADPITWSPNLNCLIGSRGTGKSTLLDYLRLALDRLRDGDLPGDLRDEINARIRETLPSTAQVEVVLEKPEGEYRIVYRDDRRQVFTAGADVPDPDMDVRALFPFRILSQREIDRSIDRRDRQALLRILDDFIRSELDSLAADAERLRGRVGEIEAALETRREGQKRRAALETERKGLEKQLDKLEKLREPLQRWQGVEVEQRFFADLFEETGELLQVWHERLEDLELHATVLTDDLRQSPNAALIAEASELSDQATAQLKAAIETALDNFEQITSWDDAPLRTIHRRRWQPLFEREQQTFEQAQLEAQAGGDDLAKIDQLRHRMDTLRVELTVLQQEADEIEELEDQRKEIVAALHRVWREQTGARRDKAEELMAVLRPQPDAKPLVEIQVIHQGDLDAAVKIQAAKIPDRRRINEQDIASLVECLDGPSGADPVSTVMGRFIAEARAGIASPVLSQVFQDRRREAFLDAYTEPVLRALEVERIPDRITYLVYRQDGTLAGPIERVSAGQQGTAILNLLLAGGEEPLVVDTPEEGLDNEGVYSELVPLFQREKEHRQIIIVTHNANIPVNASAEMIVALDAVGVVSRETLASIVQECGQSLSDAQLLHLLGLVQRKDWEDAVRKYLGTKRHWPDSTVKQVLRTIGGRRQAEGHIKRLQLTESGPPEPAVGALDAPAVKRAVQDIMEGSKEAFRRRREKYGF
jgi:DNA repair ATPase RecN